MWTRLVVDTIEVLRPELKTDSPPQVRIAGWSWGSRCCGPCDILHFPKISLKAWSWTPCRWGRIRRFTTLTRENTMRHACEYVSHSAVVRLRRFSQMKYSVCLNNRENCLKFKDGLLNPKDQNGGKKYHCWVNLSLLRVSPYFLSSFVFWWNYFLTVSRPDLKNTISVWL